MLGLGSFWLDVLKISELEISPSPMTAPSGYFPCGIVVNVDAVDDSSRSLVLFESDVQ